MGLVGKNMRHLLVCGDTFNSREIMLRFPRFLRVSHFSLRGFDLGVSFMPRVF